MERSAGLASFTAFLDILCLHVSLSCMQQILVISIWTKKSMACDVFL